MAHPTDAEQSTWKLGPCLVACLSPCLSPRLSLAPGLGLAALAGLVLALAAPAALAQDEGEEELAEEIEEIVVVGSRISRVYTAGGAPISVFDRRDIIASGTASVGDFLQQLPGQGSAVNTTYNNGGDGSVRVGFRNLQPPRTLVLVNGRRWVNSGTGADSSVDLNTIPIVMIERIEVLKDGASAVYGSDALAAVVNVITRESLDGIHFGLREGEYTAGGGRVQSYDVTFGGEGRDGNTKFIVGASFTREHALSNADRHETAKPPPSGSPGTPQGYFSYSNPVPLTHEDTGLPRLFLTRQTVSSFTANEDGEISITAEMTGDDGMVTMEGATVGASGALCYMSSMPVDCDRTTSVPNDALLEAMTTTVTGPGGEDMPVYMQRYMGNNPDTMQPEMRTLAQWHALSPTQRALFANRDDYKTEILYEDGEWYEEGRSLVPNDDDNPGAGGHIYQTVTRPDAQPLLGQYGGSQSEERNAFGDFDLACGGFTPVDGGGVDSELGEGGAIRYYMEEEGKAANFRCWNSGSDRYNYNPENYVRTPNERRSVFAIISRDLYEGHRAKLEISYQNRIGNIRLAETPLFFGLNSGESVAHDNIYNPFGVQFCSAADGGTNLCAHPGDLRDGNLIPNPQRTVWGVTGRRMVEIRNRFSTYDLESFRVAGSLQGAIDANWDYTAFWQWSQNCSLGTSSGGLNTERMKRALGGPDVCNPAAGCVPFNIFGGQGADARRATPVEATGLGGTTWHGSGSITQDMIDYVTFVGQTAGSNTLKAYGMDANGNVGSLPGGPIGVAAGFEIRTESGSHQPDSTVVAGNSSGSAIQPTGGEFSVNSLFVEGAFPWVTNGVLSVETLAAFRFSDYDTIGASLTYKLTNRLALNETLILRSTISTGFRAPSVSDLFAGSFNEFPRLEDPCAFNNGNFTGNKVTGVQAGRCAADGVPDRFVQSNVQIRTTPASNPDLDAEESDNFTFGVVFTPSPNLEISVDYFAIEIRDTISRFSDQTALNACYGIITVPDPELFCSVIERGASGLLLDLRLGLLNLGSFETSGFDGTLLWRGIDTPFGTWGLSLDFYLMDEFVISDPTSTYDAAGYVSGGRSAALIDQKLRMFVDWRHGAWDARLILEHLGAATGVRSFPPGSSEVQRSLSATQYLDGYLSYTLADMMGYGKDLRLTFGFSNLLDQDPPYFPETFANNHDPDYRTWGSQAYYLRVSGNF